MKKVILFCAILVTACLSNMQQEPTTIYVDSDLYPAPLVVTIEDAGLIQNNPISKINIGSVYVPKPTQEIGEIVYLSGQGGDKCKQWITGEIARFGLGDFYTSIMILGYIEGSFEVYEYQGFTKPYSSELGTLELSLDSNGIVMTCTSLANSYEITIPTQDGLVFGFQTNAGPVHRITKTPGGWIRIEYDQWGLIKKIE